MKKLFLLGICMLGISFLSHAQVTKADFQQLMTEIGTSVDQIENIMIMNVIQFFNDGTHKHNYEMYEKENGEYTNKIALYDNGIAIQSQKNGVENSRFFYPYESISYFTLTKTGLNIYLK